MSFRQEGDFAVTITDAKVGESKFNKTPGAIDVCIQVQTEDGQSDWWRGQWSTDMTGHPQRQGWTEAQVTFEVLQQLGFQGNDFTTLAQQLINVKTSAGIKSANGSGQNAGKTFYNVRYLGGGAAVQEAAPNVIANMANMLNGGGQQQQTQQMNQPANQQQGNQQQQQPGTFNQTNQQQQQNGGGQQQSNGFIQTNQQQQQQ